MAKQKNRANKSIDVKNDAATPAQYELASSDQSSLFLRRCYSCSYPGHTAAHCKLGLVPRTRSMTRHNSHYRSEPDFETDFSNLVIPVPQMPSPLIHIIPVPSPVHTADAHLSYIHTFVTFQIFPAPAPKSNDVPWHSHQARLTLRHELRLRQHFATLQAERGGESIADDVLTAAVARDAVQAVRNATADLMGAIIGLDFACEEGVTACQEQLIAFFQSNEGLWTHSWDRRAYDASVQRLLGCNLYRWRELMNWAKQVSC